MYLDHKVQIAIFIAVKSSVTILAKNLNFIDVFSKKTIMVILEYIKINTHIINLEKNKQSLYKPIYSPRLVKLETLKTNIKTNLTKSFIHFSKFLADTLILFIKKPDKNFWLCINY